MGEVSCTSVSPAQPLAPRPNPEPPGFVYERENKRMWTCHGPGASLAAVGFLKHRAFTSRGRGKSSSEEGVKGTLQRPVSELKVTLAALLLDDRTDLVSLELVFLHQHLEARGKGSGASQALAWNRHPSKTTHHTLSSHLPTESARQRHPAKKVFVPGPFTSTRQSRTGLFL